MLQRQRASSRNSRGAPDSWCEYVKAAARGWKGQLRRRAWLGKRQGMSKPPVQVALSYACRLALANAKEALTALPSIKTHANNHHA